MNFVLSKLMWHRTRDTKFDFVVEDQYRVRHIIELALLCPVLNAREKAAELPSQIMELSKQGIPIHLSQPVADKDIRKTILRRDCNFTLIAMAINYLGINPMRALVWAGIVQDSQRRRCSC